MSLAAAAFPADTFTKDNGASADLAVLSVIRRCANLETREAWPSLDFMAEKTKFAKSSCSRAVGRLVARGVLERRHSGRHSIYRIPDCHWWGPNPRKTADRSAGATEGVASKKPPSTDKPESLNAARAKEKSEQGEPKGSAHADLAGSSSEPGSAPLQPPHQPDSGPAPGEKFSSLRKACALVRNVRHYIGDHFADGDYALWERSAAALSSLKAWRSRPSADKERFNVLVEAMRAQPRPLDRATPEEISRERKRRVLAIAFKGLAP